MAADEGVPLRIGFRPSDAPWWRADPNAPAVAPAVQPMPPPLPPPVPPAFVRDQDVYRFHIQTGHGWRAVAMAVAMTAALALGAGCRSLEALGVRSGAVLTLAQDGKTEYVVVSAAEASEAEATAARELATYLGKVAGTTFPLLNEADSAAAPRRIFVGWTEFARAHGLDGTRLGDEEWCVRSVGPDLVVTGGRPRGTLYGVYEFLEKDVGCHWLDESTEVVPNRPDLQLARVDRRGQPAFWFRSIYTLKEVDREKEAWFCVRNMANSPNTATLGAAQGFEVKYGTPGGCHTFAAYAKNFPADRPEYLSMNAQGKRVGAVDGSGPGGICLMHPEVRKLVLARLREFVAADRQRCAEAGVPPPRIYDISQNDNHWMCQCPDCKAVSEREGSESGPLIDFINAVADGIRPEYPDIYVMTFAYAVTETPPRTLKPRDNVMIRIAELNAEWGRASDLFHPVTHPVNRAQFERLQGWSRIAKNIAEWDYWIQYSPNDKFPTPYAPVACLQPDLATFQRQRVVSVFVECEAPETTSFFALKNWLGYQLMRNPHQPAEPLIRTFMAGYYGPAAAPMREHLRLVEESISRCDANLSAMKNYDRPYLTLAFYLHCERLLDQAEALAAADAQALLHVRRERLPVDAGLYHMWPQLTKGLAPDRMPALDRARLLARYEQHRMEQLAASRTPQTLAKGKDELAKELAAMRQVTVTEARRQQQPPAARVPLTEDATAQGDPLKVDWTRARVLDTWHTTAGGNTDQKLAAWLIHDGRWLYVKLSHLGDSVRLETSDDIWSGDDWELFFAAQRAPPYRQFAFNPRGESIGYEWENLIGKCKPRPWESGAKVVSQPQEGGWTAYVVLPLDRLLSGGVVSGRAFYANFCRAMPRPERRFLAWGPNFDDSFHVPSRLPELVLE